MIRFLIIILLNILFITISIKGMLSERIITAVVFNSVLSIPIAYLCSAENEGIFKRVLAHYIVSVNFIGLLLGVYIYEGGSIFDAVPYFIVFAILILIEYSPVKNLVASIFVNRQSKEKSIEKHRKDITIGSYLYFFSNDTHGAIAGFIFLMLGLRFITSANLFPMLIILYLIGLVFDVLSRIYISRPAVYFFERKEHLEGRDKWYAYEAMNIPYYYQNTPDVYIQELINENLALLKKNRYIINETSMSVIINVFTDDSFIKRHFMIFPCGLFIVVTFLYYFIN